MIQFDPKSPWLTPFNVQIMGGLRDMISQFSDGQKTILTQRPIPTRSRTDYQYLTTAMP